MRAVLILVILSPFLVQPKQQSHSFEALLTDAEKWKFKRNMNYGERMKVLRRVLDRYVAIAKLRVERKDLNEVEVAVYAIQTLARKGMELKRKVVAPKVLRSRPVRQMEIRLRKMLRELENLKKASPSRFWDVFDEALEDIKAFRGQLLQGFFTYVIQSDPNLTVQKLVGKSPHGVEEAIEESLLPVATRAVSQTKTRSLITGDQFTNVEYASLQNAQKLKTRVKVFLRIAEGRLDEIERRRSRVKWDKDKQNPLEFYTYGQLVRAYQRSVEGIMVNIDEKMTSKSETEKNIKKTLRQLNSKIENFIPRLELVRNLAEEKRDKNLYLEWRKAWKSSQTALKSSGLSLGDSGKP